MGNTTWDRIVSGDELKQIKRQRNMQYIAKTIYLSSLEDEEEDGWELLNTLKNPKKVKVKKDKPQDEIFEDYVWNIFYGLGFTYLNRDKYFRMSYGASNAEIQQIDVFAVDDETVIIVECKSAEKVKDGVFKKEIEALAKKMNGLRSEAMKQFPNHKVKFLFATNNYKISDEDKERMKQFEILHFDESTLSYYYELVKHLGSSARYQLLSNLFANQVIKGMDNRIPAIRGKMGGHTYYSFSIEPEKLLKIGYVLHRSEANKDMMPTYQRIIKKARLNNVRKFINDEKGYFPNSIIISIDTKKTLRFDRSDKQVEGAVADLGILYLPQRYKSAYIIDGQHRLYGYSDSEYTMKNSIPVVAFENLDQSEQVKLFMEINENQKSVSKNLRNTLNADMLWTSPKESERREALKSRIAQEFGEDTESPLYGRVIIGEEQANFIKCITIDSIKNGINASNFLSKYDKKNLLLQDGTFDVQDNMTTFKNLYSYLCKCLNYVKLNTEDEWERGSEDNGFLTINTGIGGLIRIINDITNLLVERNAINPKKDSLTFMANEVQYYLDPVCRFIDNITDEYRIDIKKSYGGNAPVHCWRYFQRAISNERLEFKPEGLNKYWEENGKEYNTESLEMMADIEIAVKNIIKTKLEEAYGTRWIYEIPKSIYSKAVQEASSQQYETGESTEFWDFITLSGCKEIVTNGKNWSMIFESIITLESEKKKQGGKSVKSEWLNVINKIQNKAGKASFSVAKSQYQLLCEIREKFNEME